MYVCIYNTFNLYCLCRAMVPWRGIQGGSLMMSSITVISLWRWMKEATIVIVRVKVMMGKTLWTGPMTHTYQMQAFQEMPARRLIANLVARLQACLVVLHQPTICQHLSLLSTQPLSSSIVIFHQPSSSSIVISHHLSSSSVIIIHNHPSTTIFHDIHIRTYPLPYAGNAM